MTSPEEFDIDEWAETPTRTYNCYTCGHPAEGAIRTVAEMKAAGKTRRSWGDLHAMVVERFGYGRSIHSILRHVQRCLPEVAEAWRSRGGS